MSSSVTHFAHYMRRSLLAACLTIVATFAIGCRTNELSKYSSQIKTAHVQTIQGRGPVVYIGTTTASSNANPAVRAAIDAKNIATATLSSTLQGRLMNVINTGQINNIVQSTVAERLPSVLNGVKITPNIREKSDVVLTMQTEDYGLQASDVESALNYFFHINARMVYVPENRVIWETDEYISLPLTPNMLSSSYGFGTGTIVNMAILGQLTDVQLAETFNNMAQGAADAVVRRINEDKVRR